MINLPILESLSIEKYALYPASATAPFVATFQAGPTAVIGVNGSGKSTLINICFRCLTGPANLPSATTSGELGQIRPRSVPMAGWETKLFGNRVADGAAQATATLKFSVESTNIAVTRKLGDLSLVEMRLDIKHGRSRTEEIVTEEKLFQEKLAELIGVGTFFDVLIILTFLTFMQEDRRSLVWDSTAQRQILRILLLPIKDATEFATVQQEVIAADSAVRNTQYVLQRQEKQQQEAARRAKKLVDAEAERRLLMQEAAVLNEKLEAAAGERLQIDNGRHRARLDRLRAVERRESIVRNLEQIKMRALGQALGPSKETLKYVLGHIVSDGKCLVCGTKPSPAAPQIERWIKEGKCPICGSDHHIGEGVVPISGPLQKKIKQLETELDLAEQQTAAAEKRVDDLQTRFLATDNEFNQLDNARVKLDTKIVAVLRRIPADRRAIGTRETDVDALRRVLAVERTKRTKAENRFEHLVVQLADQARKRQQVIEGTFGEFSRVFLKENINLLFQTTPGRVGQGGQIFDFPTFNFSMSGGSVAGQTVRESPTDVSRSQAEFIDLAFRMALMSVVSDAATLVVDAPEASLDFLFAERAGQQLAKFAATSKENRVIITSYLPSDHLLRTFFAGSKTPQERKSRIVDLIESAAPNAALRADRDRYTKFLTHIVNGTRAGG